MTTCLHCGYFIQHQVPKAPAEPFWAHTGYSPTPPIGPPCDNPTPSTDNEPQRAQEGTE